MSADAISRAARRDLQFRIPRKPVLRLGLRPRAQEDAWVIDGALKSQVLGGAFAREHMADLLAACDGTRTLTQIGREIGIGEQAAFQAVSLLWTGGIVEEGDTPELTGPPPSDELACLLSRLGDSTGVNDSWQDAARRLGAASVTVVGEIEPAGQLARQLAAALEPTLPVRVGQPSREDTLVVLLQTAGPDTKADSAQDTARESTREGALVTAQQIAQYCWAWGIPLLRVRAEQEAVIVGPYVDPAFSACLSCATAADPALGAPLELARTDLAVGLVARAVAALIARATTTHLPGDVRRTDLQTLATTQWPVLTLPGCTVCSISGGSAKDDVAGQLARPAQAPVGARYEQSVAIPPAAFVDAKGHRQHYAPANLRLQQEFRDWPACPRVDLPPADLAALDQPWPTGGGDTVREVGEVRGVCAAPSLRELATILALSVGLREPLRPSGDAAAQALRPLRRWTAAGGNIGSVTAYVLVPVRAEAEQAAAERAVPDRAVAEQDALEPGTYVYVERDHVLARLGPPVDLPDGVGLRLVLSGNLDKVARKYLTFALRLVIQDAGCSFEVARIVAQILGVPLRAHPHWNEQQIATALGIDPEREPICAVVDLGEGYAH